jgi:phospholipid transport system substrate-binding protein
MTWCKPTPFVLAAALCVAASPAQAAAPTETLQGFFGSANAILQTVDAMRSLDEPRRAIRQLVDQVFDYQEAAELVLGPVWETRTPDQRTEFVRLFADFLERGFVAMIGSKASVSSGVSVQYLGETIDGQSATVSTTVLTRSGGEMPVAYSMIQGNGRWLVRDVVIEGVSLIANYRAQFARVIRTSSYGALIAKMRGDTEDSAPRERRYVVTVETTPVAPVPVSALPLSSTPLALSVGAPSVVLVPAGPPLPLTSPSAARPPLPAPSAVAGSPAVAVEGARAISASPSGPALTPVSAEAPARRSVVATAHYWVQVGAFKTADAAARVAAELRRAGLTAWHGVLTTLPGQSEPALVKVRVGPFASRADAQLKLHELVTRGYSPFIATDARP